MGGRALWSKRASDPYSSGWAPACSSAWALVCSSWRSVAKDGLHSCCGPQWCNGPVHIECCTVAHTRCYRSADNQSCTPVHTPCCTLAHSWCCNPYHRRSYIGAHRQSHIRICIDSVLLELLKHSLQKKQRQHMSRTPKVMNQ